MSSRLLSFIILHELLTVMNFSLFLISLNDEYERSQEKIESFNCNVVSISQGILSVFTDIRVSREKISNISFLFFFQGIKNNQSKFDVKL